MPIYTLKCPDCEEADEHFMGMDDGELIVDCPHCGHGLVRKFHRHYMSDVPQIQGSTVAGGCNYDGYWDDGLDCYVTSKKHRAEEMEKQGLEEYVPDPKMQAHRDEKKYIRQNSKPGDADAARALAKESHAAQKKRREAVVDQAFDKVPLPTLPEL